MRLRRLRRHAKGQRRQRPRDRHAEYLPLYGRFQQSHTFIASAQVHASVRGEAHTDGRPRILTVQTVLPPNSPSCCTDLSNPGWGVGYSSASSYHSGGVNGLRADGSVAFYSDTIDCGDNFGDSSTQYIVAEPTGKSPYGVWGALGSIGGGESTSNL